VRLDPTRQCTTVLDTPTRASQAAFVGASENMFWVCHSTLEDWQDPDHTSNFPFCAKNRKRMP